MYLLKIIIVCGLLAGLIAAGIIAGIFFGLFGDDFKITKDELIIKNGVKPYEKGKGKPAQTSEIQEGHRAMKLLPTSNVVENAMYPYYILFIVRTFLYL